MADETTTIRSADDIGEPPGPLFFAMVILTIAGAVLLAYLTLAYRRLRSFFTP